MVSPLMALTAIIMVITLTLYYKSALNFRQILPLIISSSIGIPFGILFLKNIDNQIGLIILGIMIISYSLYSLFNFSLPEIKSSKLVYVFGFLSGLSAGAYNIGAPPLIVYADCCGWNQEKFKSSLSVLFVFHVIIINISHAIQGNINAEVWQLYLYSIPSIVLGLIAGLYCSKFINPIKFRKVVLFLLLIIGTKLIISN
jgi:uncharacterized membrane protein YfcA